MMPEDDTIVRRAPAREAHDDVVLDVRGLRKRYGEQEVVRGLSFAIRRGECFGLLGPNGAGKTTTLRCVLGLVDPDGGDIALCGLPVPAQARAARRRVGVVPQMDNLDPDFTVAENLRVYGRYFGLPRAMIDERIPRLLDFAGLSAKQSAALRTLSGGMKRRLTLARALVNDPELLILDEPTTGLDPQARHLIWDGLRQLLAQGKTILLTTHFMDEAERLATRLAVIDRGVLIAADTPRQLIAQHVEPEVVEVYGDEAKTWAQMHGRRIARRLEIAGETAFCYANDAKPLLNDLASRAGVRYLHRPANLEDLFIKLTGRDLRE
ncbi:MAG: Nod factor export ATP-binding protein I [Betaproteobacteria bacterium]|nr:MAG: Nod factor export ATP-binding protein I [Betaproteobacteria bacterium]